MFSHAPWDSHPAHLSRFAVRSLKPLTPQLFLEAWNHRVTEPELHLITSRSCSRVCGCRLLREPPTCLNRHYHSPDRPILLRPCLDQWIPQWCRNINLLPITYPFRARLRGRLTHRRIILPWETLGLRREGFSPSLSLLMPA